MLPGPGLVGHLPLTHLGPFHGHVVPGYVPHCPPPPQPARHFLVTHGDRWMPTGAARTFDENGLGIGGRERERVVGCLFESDKGGVSLVHLS